MWLDEVGCGWMWLDVGKKEKYRQKLNKIMFHKIFLALLNRFLGLDVVGCWS